MVLEKLIATHRRMKLDSYLIPYPKLTQNRVRTSIKHETEKLLDENREGELCDIEFSPNFLDVVKKAQVTKAKMGK